MSELETQDYEDQEYEESDDDLVSELNEVEELKNKMTELLDDNGNEIPVEKVEEQEEQQIQSAPVEKHKVVIDGQEIEVTLDELKYGYLRQQDYSKKTAAVSNERQEVIQQRNEYTEYLNSIPTLAKLAEQNVQLASDRLASPEMVELARTRPAEYVARKAELEAYINDNVRSYNKMGNDYDQYLQQQQYMQEQYRANILQQGTEILTKTIPNWSDPATRNELAAYAQTQGIGPEELAQMIDPRQVIALYKAQQLDKLNSNIVPTRQKLKEAPTVLKPGAHQRNGNQPDVKKAMKSAKNDHDLAKILGQYL